MSIISGAESLNLEVRGACDFFQIANELALSKSCSLSAHERLGACLSPSLRARTWINAQQLLLESTPKLSPLKHRGARLLGLGVYPSRKSSCRGSPGIVTGFGVQLNRWERPASGCFFMCRVICGNNTGSM